MGKIDPNTFTLEDSFTPRVPNAKIIQPCKNKKLSGNQAWHWKILYKI